MHSYLIRISIIVATLVGLSLVISTFASSEPSDADQVVAANFSYYAALSARDLSAMERVWAQGPHDVNVAPPIKPEAHTGWNTIRKNYQTFWATLDELTVSMEDPQVVVHGPVAWVYGIERAQRRGKGGEVSAGLNFGTSIFIKEGGRWLMVFHQAALIPRPK
jgi:ketosteroid isomerase-like protein